MIASEKALKNILLFLHQLKKEHKNGKPTIYKLKFIDSIRFMSASLSSLVDNLSTINKKECKSCKKTEKISINCRYVSCKNNTLMCKCKRYFIAN